MTVRRNKTEAGPGPSEFRDFGGTPYLVCGCGCAKWWVCVSEELICDDCGEARQDADDTDDEAAA